MNITVSLFAHNPQMVLAYIDLGTGSYLFQIGLAMFMLFVYFIRSFIKSFVQYLKNAITKLIRRKQHARKLL